MSFRVYCTECEKKITPPYWEQGGVFCNPMCAEIFIAKKRDIHKTMDDLESIGRAEKIVMQREISLKYIKEATIEDLNQNSHVQGLLESYKRLIFHLPPIFVKEVEREFDLARAKLKEWDL